MKFDLENFSYHEMYTLVFNLIVVWPLFIVDMYLKMLKILHMSPKKIWVKDEYS